jgi:hypothetical protein
MANGVWYCVITPEPPTITRQRIRLTIWIVLLWRFMQHQDGTEMLNLALPAHTVCVLQD